MMRAIQLAVACVAVLVATAGQVQAGLITNGDFSTGDFTGWTVGIDPTFASGGRPYGVDTSGDGWIVSSTSNLGLAPINGFSAFNGFDGGVVDGGGAALFEADLNFFLQQDFTFAGLVSSAPLNFSFDIIGGPHFGTSRSGLPTEDRVFSVNLLDGSNSTLATVYSYTVAGTTTDSKPLQNVSLDIASTLNSLGSGTYTLSFEENIPQYFTGGGFVLDDVSLDVQAAAVPEPSSLALFGIGACVAGIGAALRRRREKQREATA